MSFVVDRVLHQHTYKFLESLSEMLSRNVKNLEIYNFFICLSYLIGKTSALGAEYGSLREDLKLSLFYTALPTDNIIYKLFVSRTNNCLIIAKFSNL